MEYQRFTLCECFTTLLTLERTLSRMNVLQIMECYFKKWTNRAIQRLKHFFPLQKVTICELSDPFWVNELLQIWQTYGFRPS